MVRGNQAVLGALVSHWENLWVQLKRVNGGVQIQPKSAYEFCKIDHGRSTRQVTAFTIGPLVINLPQRGNQPNCDLFVVVEGAMKFDLAEFQSSERLRNIEFMTEVGYFLSGGSSLQHVHGLHCDFDTARAAHPVFHAQLKSYAVSFGGHLKDQFGLEQRIENHVHVLIPNIRLPIAHLDFFSLIVQLTADHLIWQNSSAEELASFKEILKLEREIVGTSESVPWISKGAAIPCHRAIHWYNDAPT